MLFCYRSLVTFLVAAATLAFAVHSYGMSNFKNALARLIAQRGTIAALPGQLTSSHSAEPDLKKCTSCHSLYSRVSSEKCLACHENIQQRMTEQAGYHGNLKGECYTCHADHKGQGISIVDFDGKKFNHDLALYALKGKHIQLPCEKCHPYKKESANIKYIDNKFDLCSDCHSDPHLSRFEEACIVCHSENGWKGADLLFSHNKNSEFAIDQIHSNLECVSCHSGIEAVLFKPLPTKCEKCHDNIEKLSYGIAAKISSEPDPHAGRVTCAKCHQIDKQKPAQYVSNCKSCHNENYEQLYYDWNKYFAARALEAEKLLLKLGGKDTHKSTQIIERMKEADKTSFHNIDLAKKLWNQILLENSNSKK